MIAIDHIDLVKTTINLSFPSCRLIAKTRWKIRKKIYIIMFSSFNSDSCYTWPRKKDIYLNECVGGTWCLFSETIFFSLTKPVDSRVAISDNSSFRSDLLTCEFCFSFVTLLVHLRPFPCVEERNLLTKQWALIS